MTTAGPVSLWETSAVEADITGDFEGDAETDVAVVGGGFTGLSTALHAAERGLRVHVLEAKRIGYGGSGRNVGLVNAGVWHPPAAVRKALGETYGPRFVRCFADAPAKVFSLIEKHQIRCELTRSGTIHAAHAPVGMQGLRDRHAEWQRLDEPVELLSRAEVAEMTGTSAFFGGLLDHRAGTLNPMGYCRGLARAAKGSGATISVGARVHSLTRNGDVWEVGTTAGRLFAKSVVIGTNAYTDDLWPSLRRVFTPINYFQLATRPLEAEMPNILPGRHGLWDTGRIMLSLRRDTHNRLVIGSMGTIVGSVKRGLSRRWAARQLKRLFPELGPVEFEEAWHGQIAMTPDHLPRIYNLAPGLYTPIGYNGRGITTGTVFGECMADLLTGMDPAELPLPITRIAPVRSAPIISQFYQAAFTANQMLKSI